MELMQALDRLSLEVTNQKVVQQQKSNSVNDDGLPTASNSNHDSLANDLSNLNFSEDCNNTHHPNLPTPRCPSAASLRQLNEFDISIETLSAQISNLDYKQDSHNSVAYVQPPPFNDNAMLMVDSVGGDDDDCAMEDSENDESELVTLNVGQRNLDEWTVNKLYIDKLSR